MPLYVWQCTQGGASAMEVGGMIRPVCDAGQGAYVEVETITQPPEFDIQAALLASSGAILIWAVGVGIGLILNVIKRGRV